MEEIERELNDLKKNCLPQEASLGELTLDPFLGYEKTKTFTVEACIVRLWDKLWHLSCNTCDSQVSTDLWCNFCDETKTLDAFQARCVLEMEVTYDGTKNLSHEEILDLWGCVDDAYNLKSDASLLCFNAPAIIGMPDRELYLLKTEEPLSFEAKLNDFGGVYYSFDVEVTPHVANLEVKQLIKVVGAKVTHLASDDEPNDDCDSSSETGCS